MSACFGQWWHPTPMCSVSFSHRLPKGCIICILEDIPFFSLLRMIVILFQEYYLNDNMINDIYDITSNNVYKKHLSNYSHLILPYFLLTVAFYFCHCLCVTGCGLSACLINEYIYI